MIDAKALLDDLQKLLTKLEDDIRRRCSSQAEVDAPLRAQYAAARDANRTAQAYEVWRDDQITQAAVAWILGCVFVRFCEDNRLIDPPRLAGPGDRLQRAHDEHTVYVQQHPSHTDREYLLWVFEQVATLPALRDLFDHRHNPLWSLAPTGDGATALRDFWQRRDPATGQLVHDFTDLDFTRPASVQDHALDTRFLGDLYQDLSQSARKKYALLQTPIFIEKFLLDRTLEPAIREFGFREVRMIDPTCGSGHLLLGGFHRLLGLWRRDEPATLIRELAQRALDGVYGVDVNPFAVAIARFRLLMAALRACDIDRLADAPGFTIHLAAGDSLLHGPRPGRDVHRATGHLWDDDPLKHYYEAEDANLLRSFLGRQYHAVVGNPPYIVVRDRALSDAYRDRFKSCHRQYSLAVPFFERFVDLTLGSTQPVRMPNEPAGYFGMITANSFMKREFGKKLIEQFIPKWDLTHVIDTRGAYIPGHGTPTIILFGRHRPHVTTTIRTAMGIAGEPITPDDPAKGVVWTAITTQLDQPGSQSRFVSVGDTDRTDFHKHPWSIGGGGAAELKDLLDNASTAKLGVEWQVAGFGAVTREDEAYLVSGLVGLRNRIHPAQLRPLVEGDAVRDWALTNPTVAIWPYDPTSLAVVRTTAINVFLWPYRATLSDRVAYGMTQLERGLRWYEYSMFFRERFRTPLSIAFSFVATHNHFVLDRGEKIFKQTAPIIKLPTNSTEDDHLSLLGLLNSSTAGFWARQTFFDRGNGGIGGGIANEAYERFLEFDTTKLQAFPLANHRPVRLARQLDQLARSRSEWLPEAICRRAVPTTAALAEAKDRADVYLRQMIALQEELDWQSYGLYGLLDDGSPSDSGMSSDDLTVPPIVLGERAFEIVLGREIAVEGSETTWFARHGSTPITEVPDHWPENYSRLVRRRVEIIETDRNIALIERPENKRRWNAEPWESMEKRALRSWLLDRLEGWPLTGPGRPAADMSPRSLVWDEQEPRLISVARLADRLRRDGDFMQVAALYRGRDDFDVGTMVAELVEAEAVPFLPVFRYKDSGLRNRQVWEEVWDLQRREDTLDARTQLPPTDPRHLSADAAKAEKRATVGDIPVPPKYKSADMANATVWRLRGKLDVFKERFVSFPHVQRDSDPTLVVTWAGFNHLQQMQALAAYYMDAKEQEGWPADRRVPLLAGMLELLPWVQQWHNDVDPAFNQRMGNYFQEFINDEAREIGRTLVQIISWQPPTPVRSQRRATVRRDDK